MLQVLLRCHLQEEHAKYMEELRTRLLVRGAM